MKRSEAMNEIRHRLTLGRVVLPLTLLALLGGCGPTPEEVADGGDPMAALTVAVPTTRYTDPYWHFQRKEQPDLYGEALSYCQSEQEAGRLGLSPDLCCKRA